MLPKIDFKPDREGPSRCVSDCESESDFYKLFFDDGLLQSFCDETNRFAKEKIEKASPIGPTSQWFDVT